MLLPGALVTVGILVVGDAFAQTPAGDIPSAKTSSQRTFPAKVAVTDKDRELCNWQLMRQAGVVDKTRGPPVVVLNGKVISVAGNSVLKDNDPTGHAEVNAIRAACRKLGTYDLSGAVLYSNCEPCPLLAPGAKSNWG